MVLASSKESQNIRTYVSDSIERQAVASLLTNLDQVIIPKQGRKQVEGENPFFMACMQTTNFHFISYYESWS